MGALLVFATMARVNADTASVSINANQVINTVSGRTYGLNTCISMGYLDTAPSLAALKTLQPQLLRFPGGGFSDGYFWPSNYTSFSPTMVWGASFENFAHLVTNVGTAGRVTVNYGSGTPELAAAWVRHANVTNHYGIKYWEVGNELYLTGEQDDNTYPHDPYTYATRFTNYYAQMKAVDPTIKIGALVVSSEDSNANGYTSHPATNASNGTVHYGWTPVVLATLKKHGVTPDFLVWHYYPQGPGTENDYNLLHSTSQWTNYAVKIRQMVNNYFGSAPGIEFDVTEHNSVGSGPGKQTTSLVNGLYLADTFGEMMKTEFKAIDWFWFGIGADAANNNSTNLYGWRQYGNYGMFSALDPVTGGARDAYPAYYAMKLLKYFARGGDQTLRVTNSNPELAVHAMKRTNGSLTLLVINKQSSVATTATFTIAGYIPAPTAMVYTFGIPQDEAARTNGTTAARDVVMAAWNGAGPSFSCDFAPYSVTVLTLIRSDGPPPEPTDLNAVAGDTQVTLSWLPAAGATSYNVKRALAGDATYTVVGTTTSTSFTNLFVDNGVEWSYVVSAVNAHGEGVDSTVVRATPAIPLINRATGGTPSGNDPGSAYAFDNLLDTCFFSGWDARYIQYDFGAGTNWAIARYDITTGPINWPSDPAAWQFQGSLNGSTWTTLDTRIGEVFSARSSPRSFTITNNTEYRYYRLNVTANRVSGKGLRVGDLGLMAYDKNRVPSVPTHVIATPVSGAQVNLAWIDNANNETGFRIERKTGTNGAFSVVATLGAGVTTYTNTGLAPETQYIYRVFATNGIGISAASPEASAATLPVLYPPVLSPLTNRSLIAGANFSVTAQASDPNTPPRALLFSLETGPAGAGINATNGLISWRPTIAQGGSTNLFTVVVRQEQAGPITLSPVADAHVIESFPNANYGSQPSLMVKLSNPAGLTRETFMRFDMSALPSQISSASLRLTPTLTSSPGTHTLGLVPDNSWGEATITWANKPASTTVLGGWTPQEMVPVELPVTSAVQSAALGDKMLSFRLYATTSTVDGLVYYGSREGNATNAPQLVVGSPSSPGLSATQTFEVTVMAPVRPAMTMPGLDIEGRLRWMISGDAGPDYTVETSTNLSNWNVLWSTNQPSMPFQFMDGVTNGRRFYRVRLAP